MEIEILNYKDELVKKIIPEKYGVKLGDWLIQPPSLREVFITVPYRNGSLDLTEAMGSGNIYNDRTAYFDFEKIIRTDADREQVNAFVKEINGKRARIRMHGEVLTGRFKVTLEKQGKLLKAKVGATFNVWN